MKRTVAVVACALLVGACGDSDEPSSSSAAAPNEASDRKALVKEANRICEEAQPGIDQTSDQIRAAKTEQATRAGWRAQYRVLTDMFARLRAVEKAGVDKRYDAFLAKLGTVVGTVESVPDDVGDEEELNITFGAMQVYVNELGDAAIAADLKTCFETFRPPSEREG